MLHFVALISIFLGISNLLPIPALDGGRIVFVLLEVLRGRPVDPKIEARVHQIGILLLMALGLVLMAYDLISPPRPQLKQQGASMTEYAPDAEDHAFSKPPLAEVIASLRREREAADQVISSTLIYGLSDLSSEERQAIAAEWRTLPSSFKHQVLRALYEASVAMFELNFREIAGLGLQDKSSLVRSVAIDLLWTDESTNTMRQLMQMAVKDPEQAVRANALKALGPFILAGRIRDSAPPNWRGKRND